jgi:hypothetical protein
MYRFLSTDSLNSYTITKQKDSNLLFLTPTCHLRSYVRGIQNLNLRTKGSLVELGLESVSLMSLGNQFWHCLFKKCWTRFISFKCLALFFGCMIAIICMLGALLLCQLSVLLHKWLRIHRTTLKSGKWRGTLARLN